MDSAGTGPQEEPDRECELPDVTALPLATVLSTDQSVLANAVRRLRAELADEEEVVAGHSDAVR